MEYNEVKALFKPLNLTATGLGPNDIIEYEKNILRYDRWLKTIIEDEKKVGICTIPTKTGKIVIEVEFKDDMIYLLEEKKGILCSLQINKEEKLITVKDEDRLMKMLHETYTGPTEKLFLSAETASQIKMTAFKLAFHFLSQYDANIYNVKKSAEKEDESLVKITETNKIEYGEIIYQNVNTGLVALMNKNNYMDYLAKKEEMEKIWQKISFEAKRVPIEKYEEIFVEFNDGVFYIYIVTENTEETFTVVLKKENNLQIDGVSGNALVQLNYSANSPLIMMLMCTGKAEVVREVGNLATHMGMHYFCEYGGDISNIITVENVKKYYNAKITANEIVWKNKIDKLEKENDALQKRNANQICQIKQLERNNIAIEPFEARIKEQEAQINKLSSQLKAKNKKEEKDKKYNTKISKMHQTKLTDPGKLEEALNKIKHLQAALEQTEKVCDTRGNDLVIAHNEITRLENENENKQKAIDERDKTIENQKKQIQELNRNKKFQPVEAQNISAEQMKREMQLQKDNDNLLEIIVKMRRYAQQEGLDFKQMEEFKDYPF